MQISQLSNTKEWIFLTYTKCINVKLGKSASITIRWALVGNKYTKTTGRRLPLHSATFEK